MLVDGAAADFYAEYEFGADDHGGEQTSQGVAVGVHASGMVGEVSGVQSGKRFAVAEGRPAGLVALMGLFVTEFGDHPKLLHQGGVLRLVASPVALRRIRGALELAAEQAIVIDQVAVSGQRSARDLGRNAVVVHGGLDPSDHGFALL